MLPLNVISDLPSNVFVVVVIYLDKIANENSAFKFSSLTLISESVTPSITDASLLKSLSFDFFLIRFQVVLAESDFSNMWVR